MMEEQSCPPASPAPSPSPCNAAERGLRGCCSQPWVTAGPGPGTAQHLQAQGRDRSPVGASSPWGQARHPLCVTHHPLHALRAPAPCAITLGGAEMAWVLPAGGRRLSKRQSSGLLLLAVTF